ncbi:MAG: hypothetical protein NT124_00865 [Candidatus Dependentiae bacterium]|nr:hypothetical protein [Candidatus Dependentiae bacterium]
MKHIWVSIFICFFAHPSIASDCSQQAKKTCAQIVNSVGTLEKNIHTHLAYVEKNICIIDQLLDQLEDADCNDAYGVDADKLDCDTVDANKVSSLYSMQKEHVWALRCQLTSPEVRILYGASQVMAVHESTQTVYVLSKGDHNLWFDSDGTLYGYDKGGNLFKITIHNTRIPLVRSQQKKRTQTFNINRV